MRQLAIPFTLLAAFSLFGCAGPGDTRADSPELEVLENFIGVWNEERTNEVTEWFPKAETLIKVATRRWSLGGNPSWVRRHKTGWSSIACIRTTRPHRSTASTTWKSRSATPSRAPGTREPEP